MLNEPTVAASRPGIDHAVRALLLPLLGIAVMTAPGFIEAVIFWVIVLTVVVWAVNRLGLGSLFSLFSIFAVFRGIAGRTRSDWQPPTMVFRYQLQGRPRLVRLRGHDSGLELGDRVAVVGLPSLGGTHALRVTNETTGAVLARHGMVRLGAILLLDLYLALLILGHLVGR